MCGKNPSDVNVIKPVSVDLTIIMANERRSDYVNIGRILPTHSSKLADSVSCATAFEIRFYPDQNSPMDSLTKTTAPIVANELRSAPEYSGPGKIESQKSVSCATAFEIRFYPDQNIPGRFSAHLQL
jgi:hypothetical protein